MHETAADIAALQALLDRTYDAAGSHLRGVVGPERERALDQLLAFTDLARFTARPAGKLSGGMKQKLGLACAG